MVRMNGERLMRPVWLTVKLYGGDTNMTPFTTEKTTTQVIVVPVVENQRWSAREGFLSMMCIRRTINQESPQYRGIKPHYDRPQEYLPYWGIAVSPSEQAQRLNVCVPLPIIVAPSLYCGLLVPIMHLMLVAQLQVHALLVSFNHWYDGVPAICCLRNEENDANHEYSEENSAHPEGPAVTVQLNDVSSYQGAAADTREEEQIPHCDSCRPLMDEI